MGIEHTSSRGWILIGYLLILKEIEEKDGIKYTILLPFLLYIITILGSDQVLLLYSH